MSQREGGKSGGGVTLRMRPTARLKVRSQVLGEIVRECGGSADEVERAQKGILMNLLERVVVYGVAADGSVEEQIEVVIGDDGDGEVSIDLDGGRRSATEGLDAGLSHMVVYVAHRIRRRGLEAQVWYAFKEHIRNNASRLGEARAALGTAGDTPPASRDGWSATEMLRLKPGKDRGLMVSLWQSFKKKR